MSVEQAVQGFGALGEFGEIAVLQGFGERVEQAPHVAGFKGVMPWLTPFVENGWNEAVAADTYIGGADDEVVGFDVGDLGFLVGSDAFVLIMPLGEQEADGTTDQLREVTDDEPRVFTREFDLA